MSFSTITEVLTFKGPGFVGDSRLTGLETAAGMYLAYSTYGDKWIYAKALLVLHWLTLDARGGGSSSASANGIHGAVKSEKEGSLSRTYAVPSNLSERRAYLMSTSYGAELLDLSNTVVFGPINRREF